jgi:hypothetical protein
VKKNKKLALNRETLRRLGDAQAGEVAGGLITQAVSCTCTVTNKLHCTYQSSPANWC